ncbi:MAG: HAD family hydrolase [Spirochaetes bacterium]|uniref:HAD family hydrolase n=1 Tax=Candidatus Ornithospirochaeta stercoripullorum TaxID=2840899 RepID=A0A9D9E081_9SPIO|nr:HAD family hydrolase [Candidatus Ornithospirochaeta stercoripullorum]
MTMYSAIFTDIDGTLFKSDLTIGERTKEAIRQASANGMKIVLCSGRYITGMERASEQLGVPVIYAAINGALIKAGDKYLREHRIGSGIYSQLAGFVKGKVSSLIAFCENRYAIDANDEWYTLQNSICGDTGIRMDISDPDEVERKTGEKPYKILIKDNDCDKLKRIMKELKERAGGKAEIISSGWNNIEILPEGTDKREAIPIVADYLGIPVSETIAFGDWDNDAGMLEAAGLGIAMANGSEKAKEAAAHITLSNNEDGIAAALKKFSII